MRKKPSVKVNQSMSATITGPGNAEVEFCTTGEMTIRSIKDGTSYTSRIEKQQAKELAAFLLFYAED